VPLARLHLFHLPALVGVLDIVPEEAWIYCIDNLQKDKGVVEPYVKEVLPVQGSLQPSQVGEVVLEDGDAPHLLNDALGRKLLKWGHVNNFDVFIGEAL